MSPAARQQPESTDPSPLPDLLSTSELDPISWHTSQPTNTTQCNLSDRDTHWTEESALIRE